MFDRKLPGKQEWSGRRRTTTRVSGYHSHKDATGGHYAVEGINQCYWLEKGEKMSLIFDVDEAIGWSGFGGYFWYQGEISVSLSGLQKKTLKIAPSGLWSKFGSMWEGGKDTSVKVVFEAIENSNICFYDHASGEIGHRHLDSARSNLLGNMHQFSPEAHFFTSDSSAPVIEGGQLHRVEEKFLLFSNSAIAVHVIYQSTMIPVIPMPSVITWLLPITALQRTEFLAHTEALGCLNRDREKMILI